MAERTRLGLSHLVYRAYSELRVAIIGRHLAPGSRLEGAKPSLQGV